MINLSLDWCSHYAAGTYYFSSNIFRRRKDVFFFKKSNYLGYSLNQLNKLALFNSYGYKEGQ